MLKHQDLLEKMSLEEKAAILSGQTVWQSRAVERLGIPSIFCSDGPHGIRKQAGAGDHLGLNASIPATCFPTAATMANSWDEELGEEVGAALGQEAASMDVNVLLGPGLNIKRSPLCGRNFEYFSEDPYHAGKMAASYVKGIQSEHVYACPKHFAVNSQELRRMAMNSVVDERTLREIYLTGFEIAVKEANAKTIMSSYNEINGVYANENKHLLQEILREEWGFDGIVITDWGASNDHVQGVAAGSNLEMPEPGLDSARLILKAIENKTLTMEELDACVDDLVDAALGQKAVKDVKAKSFDEEAHHQLARRAAAESAVLLKNEEQILPLAAGTRVALIGDFALTPRYQGAGSSMVNTTKLDTMEKVIGQYDLQVEGICKGYQRNGQPDEALVKEAMELAEKVDVVLYCFGLDELSESEGLDRDHMRIPQNQIILLEKLAQANSNVVGIISAGSSIEMPWDGELKGILHCYLNGQAGASAVFDLLMGKAVPSGKLNETYPLCYEDTPAFYNFPSKERNAEYREAVYVGYRYYDTCKKAVRYPFGYGLSYTTFAYENLEAAEDHVQFKLTNTGKYDGAEVVQLYVGLEKSEIFRPAKELKGFKKVFLKAGESQTVTIPFDDKTFRYFNVKTNKWEVESGVYTLMIGASSADIRLTGTVEKTGSGAPAPYDKEKLAAYYTGDIQKVDQQTFETMLGRKICEGHWSGELTVNDAICQMYYAKSGLARFAYKKLTAMKKKSEEKGTPDLNILFIYNMPFRAIAKMTNGAVSMEMTEGIVKMVNGHFFSGLGQVISGFFRNKKLNKAYEQKLRSFDR